MRASVTIQTTMGTKMAPSVLDVSVDVAAMYVNNAAKARIFPIMPRTARIPFCDVFFMAVVSLDSVLLNGWTKIYKIERL